MPLKIRTVLSDKTLEKLADVSTDGTKEINENGNNIDVKTYKAVDVNISPNLQDKTIIPSANEQIISADPEYDGLSEITVEGITNKVDENITPNNIKHGVTILGVEGSFEGGFDRFTGNLIPTPMYSPIGFYSQNRLGKGNGNIYRSISWNKAIIYDPQLNTWTDFEMNITDFSLDPQNIWTDSLGNLYQSSGGRDYQLKFNPNTHTWEHLYFEDKASQNVYGNRIWSDLNGTIYYSEGDEDRQLVWNPNAQTWSKKTWYGIDGSEFGGQYIWNDGTNVYYSDGSYSQYKLNEQTSTWESMDGGTVCPDYGNYIGTDSLTNKIYYSNGSQQYVLDTNTNTWSEVSWVDEDGNQFSFSGSSIGIDNLNVIHYDSSDSSYSYIYDREHQYFKLNYHLGFEVVNAQSIWTDGENIYCNPRSGLALMLDKETNTGRKVPTSIITNPGLPYGDNIWTDGDDIYYSSTSAQYVLNKDTKTWESKTWSGMTSYAKNQFYGYGIGTDGIDIYFDRGGHHYKLNKTTKTWSSYSPRCDIGGGNTRLEGDYIGTDGNNIYFTDRSRTGYSFKLNEETKIGVYEPFYYSNFLLTGSQVSKLKNMDQIIYLVNSSYAQPQILNLDKNLGYYNLNKNYFSSGMSTGYGGDFWTDGSKFYYSDYDKHYYYNGITWSSKSGSTLTKFYGRDIGLDGENVYYSSGSSQYIKSSSNAGTAYDGSNSGLVDKEGNQVNLNGRNIGKDGETIYYSSGNLNFVFDKSTKTGTKKTGNLPEDFDLEGKNIGIYNNEVYYINYEAQYKLNRSNGSWIQNHWYDEDNNDLKLFKDYIWETNENAYYSNQNQQYVLNKTTLIWEPISWNREGMNECNIGVVEGQVYNNGKVLNKYSHYWEPKTGNFDNRQVSLLGNYFIELDGEIYFISTLIDERYNVFKLEKKSTRKVKLRPTLLPKI